MKTAAFAAGVMELLGYETEPASSAVRHDIIQMIHMREPEALKKFCKGIQFGAPVDSYVTPEPWDMPGYDCQVTWPRGAFVQGASIELSADAPSAPLHRLSPGRPHLRVGPAGRAAGGAGAAGRERLT